MRYSFVALSFASLAVANPLGYGYDNDGYNVYPTGGQPSSSAPVYGVPTLLPASSKPDFGNGYGHSSSAPVYGASTPVPSSSKPDYGNGYGHSSSVALPSESKSSPFPSSSKPDYGPGYGSSTSVVSSSSKPDYGHGYPNPSSSSKPSYGTGYSTKPQPSTTEYTTYTTTTVCPVTETHGTSVITTSTTSTVTVTECKGGCHHASTPVATPTPSKSQPAHDVTTTITQTTYTWVPCSTPVGHSGYSTIYSTYLTPSYITQTLTSTIYGCHGKACETPAIPQHPEPTTDVSVRPAGTPPVYSQGPKPSAPVTPVPDNCPAPITQTLTVYIPAGSPAPGYITKSITVTEEGHPQTYVVTLPGGKPTNFPQGPKPSVPGNPESPKPLASGGYSLSSPSSFSAPYPTSKPVHQTPSSSVRYPVHTPSSKPTPAPTSYPSYGQGYGY